MAVYRVQMQFPADSALPRDIMQINPHFFGDNPDALLNALKANLNNWAGVAGKPFTLKAYDAAQLPPSYPLATVSQANTTPNTPFPREVAICLSYYTTWNRPSYRGRLYLPAYWITTSPGKQPTAPQRDTVLTFATQVLTKSLPANHNWVVWSSKLRKSQGGVSNIWCDDEWDTVRSRGMKASTRTVGTV